MSELVLIASSDLTVSLSTKGAEPQSVVDSHGRDWLWNGDPQWWTGRAPIIFPTVGVTNGDVARFGGEAYPLGKHGFARQSDFALIETGPAQALFRLEDDDKTRSVYPFAFRLDVRYAVEAATLSVKATVTNRDRHVMPVGFGFHPAFRWPLPGNETVGREAHVVAFDAAELEDLRELSDAGLTLHRLRPTPVEGRTLRLRDALFDHDALIWDRPHSRGVGFGVPGGAAVRVEFPDMSMLGIWTKPGGAPFLCVEPWHSRADDEGFQGEFAEKPGVLSIAPDGHHEYAMTIHFDHRL